MPVPSRCFTIRPIAAIALAITAHASWAQAPIAPAGEQEVGLALRSQPAVDGRSERKLDVVPLLDLATGPWFARTTRGVAEAGAWLRREGPWRVGVVVAFEAGRQTSGVDALSARGVPDLSNGLSVGPTIEWLGTVGPAPVSALFRVRVHGHTDRGSQADARVTVGLAEGERLRLGAFGQMTWAEAGSMNASFGVDPALASRSGLPAYEAGGGLRQASGGLLGTWRLTPTWALAGTLEARALGTSPTGSPLVSRRGAVAAVLGVTYAF